MSCYRYSDMFVKPQVLDPELNHIIAQVTQHSGNLFQVFEMLHDTGAWLLHTKVYRSSETYYQ
jgi:hypothetical protein